MISFKSSRAHLFNACDSYGLFHPSVLALAGQFVVDLAGAENDSLHLVGAQSRGAALGNHALEVGACGVKQRGFAPAPGFAFSPFLCRFTPGSMLSKLDLASGWRSSDLGVNMISWSSKKNKKQKRGLVESH